MHVIKFNVATEVRKVLKGKKTKVPLESLILAIGPKYLEMLKAAKEQAGEQADEQADVAELERRFRLEDPRG
jgi:hypothetical protein